MRARSQHTSPSVAGARCRRCEVQHTPRRRRAPGLALLSVLLAAACAADAVARVGAAAGPAAAPAAAAGIKLMSIPAFPGCTAGAGASQRSRRPADERALLPELQHCSWSVQMQRQSQRWYAFDIAPEAADNMSVVIMARAVSGQITMALWGPGSDPSKSVPTQVGTNYAEWPGLREADQEPTSAGGGHPSLASEQQYLFLNHRGSKPLLVGQYVVMIQADMGQPLVSVEVNTPSSMTQLVAEEQEALKQLVADCCPGMAPSGTSEALAAEAAAAAGLGGASEWCGSVGRAVTYDLRQWYADICHVAPNVCSREGHLQRLVLPPYALRCSAFPKALAKFAHLRHLDVSFSGTPGALSDVAGVAARLPELRQLHLRGAGLSGPLGCDLMRASSKLEVLSLSDNDRLTGSLPGCWLAHPSLHELQLAGLSGLTGPLPDITSAPQPSSATSSTAAAAGERDGEQLCGFGRLKYINLAGVIGDAGVGFTGTLPPALGFCKELLYLDLSGHSLSGPLPAPPTSIQFLNLSSNALSGALPEFAVDAQLQYLDLSFNRFAGTLQDMTLLAELDWLDLSDNSLSGPLPPLPSGVRWVDLSNNALTGDIKLPVSSPRHAGRDTALVLYNVARNRLTGAIPAALAAQTNLAFLDMSHNELSGSLDAFAAALPTQNMLLQVNFSHNRLTGGIPAQLQHLAAVRPALVTMKDGLTPVTRIFDVSHNEMSGMFPAWLVTNIPQLVTSCKCSVGVNMDSEAFSCPSALPRLSAAAQTILRRFEFLQCMADGSAPAAGGAHTTQRRLVPIWHVAAWDAAAGQPGRNPMTRAEHKAAMERFWAQQETLQQVGGAGQRRGHAAAATAWAVLGLLVAGAGVALAAVKAQALWSAQQLSQQAQRVGYSRLPDFHTFHPTPASSFDGGSSSGHSPHALDGFDSPYSQGGSSPRSTASSSSRGSGSGSGSRTSRSSVAGDNGVEIALVMRPSTDVLTRGVAAGSAPAPEQLQASVPGSVIGADVDKV